MERIRDWIEEHKHGMFFALLFLAMTLLVRL